MTTLTIRGLDPATKQRLRVRAAQHGRSMEAEVRAIIEQAVSAQDAEGGGLGTRIHARFAAMGGADFDVPDRIEVPRAAEFE